uniref:Uncharacterized protein n=1 Tax=Panagrolaimus davidi TaxID=227884 RepID=A0A914PK56_9BILA
MAMNFLMDTQFGFQPLFESSFREQIRGTLARNCMYNFVPHCINTRKSGEENKETSLGLGQSVRAVVNVVNTFLTALEPDISSETLLNVLTFYLEFTGYVHCITGACNSTKTILLEKGAFEPPPLSYDALFKLLNFVTVKKNISEELWQIVQMIRIAFPRFDGYLRNCNAPGKPPGSSSTQLSQANMCFTSISPPSSISPTLESMPLSNTVKLPELTFAVSKSIVPETSSAFRRAKNHSKMWHASNAGADPFDYEGFESGFDTMRAYTNEQVFEKPNVDRTETLFVLFIKFINTCSQLGPVCTIAVQRYQQTISLLIDLLNECESAVDPVTEVNTEFWQPQTLADHLLYILLSVSNAVGLEGDNARRFMQVSLQTIFKETTEKNEITKISDPLIFALMKLNYQLQRKELFVQLDGMLKY